jgi:tetratricopeptide (TPR) repeat protein
VWLAERADGLYEGQVAIKILHPWFLGTEVQQHLQREIQILARLHHPRIVRLMGGGFTPEGTAYLVMEYVAGTPLDRSCRERQLSVREKVMLMGKVCEALSYAHQQLIAHLDLKPGNILVDEEGRVKLLDFGVAWLLGPDRQRASEGITWSYASPEQLRGREGLSAAADQWAVGVVLYELVCGRRPWLELEHDVARYRQAVAEDPIPRPRNVVRGLDRDLEAMILRCLEREPERRYASMEDLRWDLERYLEGKTVAARPVPGWIALGRNCRRHWLASSLTVIVVLLAAGWAWTWVTNQQKQREELERRLAVERVHRVTELAADLPRSLDPKVGELLEEASISLQRVAQQKRLSAADAMVLAHYAANLGGYAGHPAVSGWGKLPQAERYFRTGLVMVAQGRHGAEHDLQIRRQRADLQHLLAGALIEGNRAAEAEELLREALASVDWALGRSDVTGQERDKWRALWANLWAARSRVDLMRGDLRTCIGLRRQAVAEVAALYEEAGGANWPRTMLAGMKAALGWALRENGQAEEALREYEEARVLLEDYLKPNRLRGYETSTAARGLYEEGRILLSLSRTREAERRLAWAIEVFRRLQREAPLSPMVDRTLMRALARQAEVGKVLGWPEPRRRALAEAAAEVARKVERDNPGNAKVPGEIEEVRAALERAGLAKTFF